MKTRFQWSDLFSFGLSLWLNHYPVLIVQSLTGTCPLWGREWHSEAGPGAGTAQVPPEQQEEGVGVAPSRWESSGVGVRLFLAEPRSPGRVKIRKST